MSKNPRFGSCAVAVLSLLAPVASSANESSLAQVKKAYLQACEVELMGEGRRLKLHELHQAAQAFAKGTDAGFAAQAKRYAAEIEMLKDEGGKIAVIAGELRKAESELELFEIQGHRYHESQRGEILLEDDEEFRSVAARRQERERKLTAEIEARASKRSELRERADKLRDELRVQLASRPRLIQVAAPGGLRWSAFPMEHAVDGSLRMDGVICADSEPGARKLSRCATVRRFGSAQEVDANRFLRVDGDFLLLPLMDLRSFVHSRLRDMRDTRKDLRECLEAIHGKRSLAVIFDPKSRSYRKSATKEQGRAEEPHADPERSRMHAPSSSGSAHDE